MSNDPIECLTRAQTVLLQGAEALTKYKVQRALGQPTDLDPSTIDVSAHDDLWKALVPIIQSASMREKIDAKTSQDIVKLLANGKVSVSEARELMTILKLGAEVEAIEKGGMTALDTAPGVTIILPSVEPKPKLIGGIHTGTE